MAPKKNPKIQNDLLSMFSDITKEKTEALKGFEEIDPDSPFERNPVDIIQFLTDPDYLGNTVGLFPGATSPLSQIQEDYLRSVIDFENKKNFYVLWWGKGSGKNFVARVTFAYIIYFLQCLKDPHKYFGRANSLTPITLMNVAVNEKTAKDNFFTGLCSLIREAGPKAYPTIKLDSELKSQSMLLPKNIQVISASSTAQEGYDILVGLVDECDQDDFTNVDSVFQTLKSSSSTRFYGKEKIITISYSRYVGSNGKIEQLYNIHKDKESSYVSRAASWDVKPDPRATKQFFYDKYYEEDPEAFRFLYECDTSVGTMDSWIKDVERLKTVMREDRRWIFGMPLPSEDFLKSTMSETRYTLKDKSTWSIDPYDLPIRERGQPGINYVFVGDPGAGDIESSKRFGGDAYGVALGHVVKIVRENGETYYRTVVDFTFRFTGRMFAEGQIQMSAIENLIDKLYRYGYNIKIFSFDPWNSLSTIQNIRKKYKGSTVYNQIVKIEHYSALRDSIFGEAPPSAGGDIQLNGGIDLPYHPILFWELRNLIEDRKLKKVDHRTTTTKDMSDALAMLNFICTKINPQEDAITISHDSVRKLKMSFDPNLQKAEKERARKQMEEQMISRAVGLGGLPDKKPSKGIINLNVLDPKKKWG